MPALDHEEFLAAARRLADVHEIPDGQAREGVINNLAQAVVGWRHEALELVEAWLAAADALDRDAAPTAMGPYPGSVSAGARARQLRQCAFQLADWIGEVERFPALVAYRAALGDRLRRAVTPSSKGGG